MSICLHVFYVHNLHAWCLEKPDQGVWYPGTGVMVVSHHVGREKPNLGLLQRAASDFKHGAISTAPRRRFCLGTSGLSD